MKRPLIGVVPGWDTEKKRYSLGEKYTGWIERCGGTPVLLPYTVSPEVLEQMAGLLDGLLLSGGPDVSPELYGEQKLECCGNCQLNRDEMEISLFRLVEQKYKKPVLGICKGCQIINTALGGTLYQDLKTQYPGDVIDHRRIKDGNEAPEGETPGLFKHMATLTEDGPLARLMGESEVEITTYHHQAAKKLADGLKVMATAPDGVIEAFYRPGGQFLWGVQFHPEMFDYGNRLSEVIFSEFIKSCKG